MGLFPSQQEKFEKKLNQGKFKEAFEYAIENGQLASAMIAAKKDGSPGAIKQLKNTIEIVLGEIEANKDPVVLNDGYRDSWSKPIKVHNIWNDYNSITKSIASDVDKLNILNKVISLCPNSNYQFDKSNILENIIADKKSVDNENYSKLADEFVLILSQTRDEVSSIVNKYSLHNSHVKLANSWVSSALKKEGELSYEDRKKIMIGFYNSLNGASRDVAVSFIETVITESFSENNDKLRSILSSDNMNLSKTAEKYNMDMMQVIKLWNNIKNYGEIIVIEEVINATQGAINQGIDPSDVYMAMGNLKTSQFNQYSDENNKFSATDIVLRKMGESPISELKDDYKEMMKLAHKKDDYIDLFRLSIRVGEKDLTDYATKMISDKHLVNDMSPDTSYEFNTWEKLSSDSNVGFSYDRDKIGLNLQLVELAGNVNHTSALLNNYAKEGINMINRFSLNNLNHALDLIDKGIGDRELQTKYAVTLFDRVFEAKDYKNAHDIAERYSLEKCKSIVKPFL